MKALLLAGSAVLTIGMPALAADYPVKASPRAAQPVPYTWTACHIGGHVGAGWSRTVFSEPDNFQNIIPVGETIGIGSPAGLLGGVQAGCDYQFASNWVIGLAGDFSWAHISGTGADPFFNGKSGGPLTLNSRTDWLASVTGRIGYGFSHVLIYAKGGAAWAHDRYQFTDVQSFNNFLCFNGGFTACNPTGSATRFGWVAGAGVEWAAGEVWSIFAEYDHYFFGTKGIVFTDPNSIGTPPPYDVKQDIDTVKIGINYRFGARPLVAQY